MTNIVKNKNGIEFDIDAIATDLNGKMDRDGVNAECPTLLSRTPNSQGGVVEIWSDGYCVQTGIVTNFSDHQIILDQAYKDTNYIINILQRGLTHASIGIGWVSGEVTTTSFWAVFYEYKTGQSSNGFQWRTEGYIR